MEPGSSQESESDRASQDDGFTKPHSKKRGRKPKATPTTPTPEAKRPALQRQTASTSQMQGTTTKAIAYIPNTHSKCSHTFVVYAPPTTSRVQMALKWEDINTNNKDIIIKQENNFLIKTNDEQKTTEALRLLLQQNVITSFKLGRNETTSTQYKKNTNHHNITASCSVVATGVDLEITDEMFFKHLERMELRIRFCKRIISRQRNAPTLMMRLITGDLATYEKLMNERAVHFLGRVFRIVESKPPAPIPAPCNKCNAFDHRTEECKTPIKCNKCQGPHPTTTCKSPLPIKCAACKSDDHAAWSMKCPKRPTAPIDGIPNVKIKCLNRRTNEVSDGITVGSRIHRPITTHDFIINKYKHQLNKTTNTNREELVKKLRKQFVEDFNIDTSVVFFGSHMYILMFDLLQPNRTSQTEPLEQLRQTITNTGHSI
ncbi:uncharacterized protein [Euwallacea similis]|uniref:uncharacterized protein n=1 Tax=Euwallacea similis TaxID=1736056 RepID=UPI00344CAD5D